MHTLFNRSLDRSSIFISEKCNPINSHKKQRWVKFNIEIVNKVTSTIYYSKRNNNRTVTGQL